MKTYQKHRSGSYTGPDGVNFLPTSLDGALYAKMLAEVGAGDAVIVVEEPTIDIVASTKAMIQRRAAKLDRKGDAVGALLLLRKEGL